LFHFTPPFKFSILCLRARVHGKTGGRKQPFEKTVEETTEKKLELCDVKKEIDT
jgi:hypothetical protein